MLRVLEEFAYLIRVSYEKETSIYLDTQRLQGSTLSSIEEQEGKYFKVKVVAT